MANELDKNVKEFVSGLSKQQFGLFYGVMTMMADSKFSADVQAHYWAEVEERRKKIPEEELQLCAQMYFGAPYPHKPSTSQA